MPKNKSIRPKASPGFLVRRLQQLAVSMFIQALEEFKITPIQYTILGLVERSDGLDQAAIAAKSVLDASTVTDVVVRLEERGLVVREPCPDDKRRKNVRITEAGSLLLRTVEPHVNQSRKRLLSPLSPEEAASLLYLIEKVLTGHGGEGEPTGKAWRRLKPRD